MSRLVGMVCAGVLLLAAGCLPDSFRLPFTGPPNQQLVVTGSVNEVSTLIREALDTIGVSVVSELHGDDLRMVGVTKTKNVFCFHLRQAPETGAKTQIVLQWDKWVKQPDEDLWRTVVQAVSAPPPA